MTKVWIAKWALTEGIFEAEVEISESYPHMAKYYPEESRFPMYLHNGKKKKDFLPTRDEAIAEGERLRFMKIASLEKQIKRIREHQLV